jgi:hypothetical protein
LVRISPYLKLKTRLEWPWTSALDYYENL